MKINIENSGNSFLLIPSCTADTAAKLNSEWFNAEYWVSNNRVVGESSGRNTTWFIRPELASGESVNDTPEWVLRHYYRGGMVAKISRDKFVYTGIKNTRPYQEMALLLQMRSLKLPVPVCVGARVVRSGLTYSADLLMEKIIAMDLVKQLSHAPLNETQWNQIGKTIAQFHQHGIYHADLNAHNIMIDQQQKIWIIDFDRCRTRKPETHWQQQNLSRLNRSLCKEKGLDSGLAFEEVCWEWLTRGYSQA